MTVAGNTSDHPLCDGRANVACHDPIIPHQATLTQFRRELCAVGLQATGRERLSMCRKTIKTLRYVFSDLLLPA